MSHEQLESISPLNIASAEKIWSQSLKGAGMKLSKQRSIVLRRFLETTEPITVHDLFFLVKKDDLLISMNTVWRAMKTIVACGLGEEISSANGSRYSHRSTMAQAQATERRECQHPQLICKDCGAEVSERIGKAGKEEYRMKL